MIDDEKSKRALKQEYFPQKKKYKKWTKNSFIYIWRYFPRQEIDFYSLIKYNLRNSVNKFNLLLVRKFFLWFWVKLLIFIAWGWWKFITRKWIKQSFGWFRRKESIFCCVKDSDMWLHVSRLKCCSLDFFLMANFRDTRGFFNLSLNWPSLQIPKIARHARMKWHQCPKHWFNSTTEMKIRNQHNHKTNFRQIFSQFIFRFLILIYGKAWE